MPELPTICLDIKGNISIPDPDNPGDFKRVVFQGTSNQFKNYETGLKKPRMVRAHVIPDDPMTSAQINQRTKLSLAVAAWHIATPEEKETARSLAKGRNITLYMAFLSQYMRALPPLLGTIWDGGSTTWNDAGTTTLWDL